MENKNLVTVKGYIGNIRKNTISGLTYSLFSLATESFDDAGPRTVWHNLKVWENSNTPAELINSLEKGMKITATGRLNMETYTDIDNRTSHNSVILCRKIEIADKNDNSFINAIELTGRVTSRSKSPDNDSVINLVMATSYAFMDQNKNACISTTWHNLKASTEKFDENFLASIGKGTNLTVKGRMEPDTDGYGNKTGTMTIIPENIQTVTD